MKSVQIRRFFWFVFSHIRTEYGCPYSVRMRENMDQKNSVFGCFLCSVIVQVFIIWRLKKSRIFMFSSYYRFVYKGDELIKVSEQWNAVFHMFVFPPHFSLICLFTFFYRYNVTRSYEDSSSNWDTFLTESTFSL